MRQKINLKRRVKMKIISFSDLHVNISRNNLGIDIRPHIIKVINEANADIVIIAGDISDFANMSIEFLDRIENETNVKVYFIPGNHDVWHDNNCWESYNLFKNHKSTLIDNPILLENDYVLIGDMGWYDYSFGPSMLTTDDFDKSIRETTEGKYTKWGTHHNKDICNIMIDKFQNQLEKFKNKKIIFTNHFIPYIDFITYSSDFNWNVLNSIMGSENIGILLDQYPNIEYIIFGHTHRRFGNNGIVDFGSTKIICNPLGYAKEWIGQYSQDEITKDIHKVIENEIKVAMTTIYI
jgi:putative phosphoesterase